MLQIIAYSVCPDFLKQTRLFACGSHEAGLNKITSAGVIGRLFSILFVRLFVYQ